MKREMMMVFLSLFILGGIVGTVYSVASAPIAPRSLDIVSSERNDNYTAQSQAAEAGNITKMNITGWTQSQTWAGFVGNVTGRIVLDDASNKSLYEWFAAEPQGEVYAVNSSEAIVWSNVSCFDMVNNLTDVETSYGLEATDYDGVDETFNDTNHPDFWIGTYTITGCPTTNMFTDDAVVGDKWYEALLFEDTNNVPVYVAIIEDDTANSRGSVQAFDGGLADYQMIVGIDGHDGADEKWDYYFYVELE